MLTLMKLPNLMMSDGSYIYDGVGGGGGVRSEFISSF